MHGRNNQNYQPKKEHPNFEFKEPFFINGKLNLKWVKEEAQRFAKFIADESWEKMNTTALRNFYNEMLRIRDLASHSPDEQFALIRLLIAKVNYKKKQPGNKIPEDFVKFMTNLVNEVNDDSTRFNQACLIMEAIVGYNPKK